MAQNTSLWWRAEVPPVPVFCVVYDAHSINCGKYFQSRLITSSRFLSRRGVHCYFICESWNMECETCSEFPAQLLLKRGRVRGVSGWLGSLHEYLQQLRVIAATSLLRLWPWCTVRSWPWSQVHPSLLCICLTSLLLWSSSVLHLQ